MFKPKQIIIPFIFVLSITILYIAGFLPVTMTIDRIFLSYPDFFTRYAACGIPEKEAIEFKELNDHFGTPGNPGTTFGDSIVGVWVTVPIPDTSFHIELKLEKNYKTDKMYFTASLCELDKFKLPSPGNPKIEMPLPLSALHEIIEDGIPKEMIDVFFETVEKSNWESILSTEAYFPKQDIILKNGITFRKKN